MPVVDHPDLGQFYIPFDPAVIANYQFNGIQVFPDPGAAPARLELENELIRMRQTELWQKQLHRVAPNVYKSPRPDPGLSPSIPDRPGMAERLIEESIEGAGRFPFRGGQAPGQGVIRQVLPNPTVSFTGDEVPGDYLLRRALKPPISSEEARALPTAETLPLAAAARPAPLAPLTLPLAKAAAALKKIGAT